MSDQHVIIEDRYAQIPEALLYDPDIPAEAVRVYGVLHRHGSDPANCYPSHARIAGFIGGSPRSVQTWIRNLEDKGWLERIPRLTEAGDPDSNGYRLFSTPRVPQRGVRAAQRGGVRASQRGGYALHSAPKESQLNESNSNERRDEAEQLVAIPVEQLQTADPDYRFDDFWDGYPKRNERKVGKEDTRRRWRKLSYPDKSDAFKAMKHYAAECNSGRTLAKDPHRWLEHRCWVDWLTPTPTSPRAQAADKSHLDANDALVGAWADYRFEGAKQ